jgi:hypothetical protein
MKSPWQIGLLAVAITGVSAYDYIFFSNRTSDNRPTASIQADPETGLLITERADTAAFPAGTEASSGSDFSPAISLERLQLQAQKRFMPGEGLLAASDDAWPERDPFNAAGRSVPNPGAGQNVTEPEGKAASATLPSLQEQQFNFTGTLIEHQRRLALINGDPQAIGARLGVWQLARIESDYIILKSGDEIRRIELIDIQNQAMNQKDPL